MALRSRRGTAATPERETVSDLLLNTLPGRALVIGAALRVLASLTGLIAGHSTVVDAIGTVGTLALLVATGFFVWRLIALGRRRLLWRVRRKLILSYIFVGLVPVLLVIIFFGLCGFLLYSTISSYIVESRVRGMVEQAQFLASTAAIELDRSGTPEELRDRLERKQRLLQTRYPDVSLAVVPTNRCGGEDSESRHGAVGAIAAGPWPHVAPPAELPAWVPCTGFSGLMAFSVPAAAPEAGSGGGDNDEASGPRTGLFVRAVAVPDGAPDYAVVADLPITEIVVLRMREETGIRMTRASLSAGSGHPQQGRASAPVLNSPDRRSIGDWVVLFTYTDWATGKPGSVTVAIRMTLGEIYDRLSPPSRTGGRLGFGQALVVLILAVGLLFLLIQFVALVMGLALARSITGSVHELFVGTARVRQGDFSHQIEVRANDQLGELADSFNSMTARLAQLLAEMAEKKRLEEELRIARHIQMSLLPQRPPMQLPGVALTALCAPAREVGGDYYDFLPLGGHRLGVLIADVSGKGTSAALYMAELKGLMLSLSQIHRSPRELLIAADRLIADNLDNRSFITVTYAVLDLEARTLTWARAGHTPLIHLPGGDDRGGARVLVSGGLVLGLKLDNGERFAGLLEEVTIPLQSGDMFMLFTDGLSEQMNPGEELFGEARLAALIEEHRHLPFDELRERIVREVTAFAAGAAQHDDMTFILLRVDALPASQAGAPLGAAVMAT